MQMYWLYDRYNMYAFSLVNSINKTMKTLSFYKSSWLFLCNSAPWNRWSWRMDWLFLRQPSSSRNLWGLTSARKRVQFFFLPLLLPTGGFLFLGVVTRSVEVLLPPRAEILGKGVGSRWFCSTNTAQRTDDTRAMPRTGWIFSIWTLLHTNSYRNPIFFSSLWLLDVWKNQRSLSSKP